MPARRARLRSRAVSWDEWEHLRERGVEPDAVVNLDARSSETRLSVRRPGCVAAPRSECVDELRAAASGVASRLEHLPLERLCEETHPGLL